MTERESFRSQAIETLRREIPEGLDWLTWSDLPQMRWNADDQLVDEVIPRGWLVAAARRNEPEPDLELVRQGALFSHASRSHLAGWLLGLWVEHDTVVPTLTEERRAELRMLAERGAELAQRWGRSGTDPEERYRKMLALEENPPTPSALPHKGLLAVVAVCGDADTVEEVERYVERWHGERPEQVRVLLRMVSWIEGSAADDLLSSAARLPTFRELAQELLGQRSKRG